MNSPFIFEVAALLRGSALPVLLTQSGPSPTRIGPEMIAIPEGGKVVVEAQIIPLGGGLAVEADVEAQLVGQCSRCLRELTPTKSLHVSEVFSADPDFITGEDAPDDIDELPVVNNDKIDLLQSVLDEAGMSLPFNPVCAQLGYGACENDDVPAPDGESEESEGEEKVDPRWAGLEKFL
ncbi:YceD family protein [Corynebacterium crudilactis]|uniref:DNA-binding protein n=1 Tax=Corynebacterium crudilactis TaxID=1652495 RepID=A0A172QUE9_9CORY|nr:YceD family protein [Corynebacterium crudilactis]ANE04339.1 DNA-binding protein [Corynebacterium crudilactis]